MRKIGLLGLIGLISPILVFAYTSPGRATGYVNDFAGVLSVADKADLETQLTALHKDTSAEIAVVIVPTVGTDETIETYAVKLFEEWGIGQKGKDNGALILVAKDDREMRIEVGYGLEGIIPDATAFAIVDKILTPAFKAGDFAGGLKQAVTVMGQAIAGDPSALPAAESPVNPLGLFVRAFPFAIVGILVFVQGMVAAMARSKSWWLGGVFGAVAGGVVTLVGGFMIAGLLSFAILIPLGLLLDWYLSRNYASKPWWTHLGQRGPWWFGGGRGGGGLGGGGGFGGFGGGGSGGGGSSGRF